MGPAGGIDAPRPDGSITISQRAPRVPARLSSDYDGDGMTDALRDAIRVRGARQNNLKSLDLDIPLNELIVVTGV